MIGKSQCAPHVLVAIALAGCSSAAPVSLGHGELSGTGGSSTAAGGARSKSAAGEIDSGASTVTSGGAVGSIDAGASSVTSGGGTGSKPGCAEMGPADVYVMFDQSSSMNDPYPVAGLGTWWDVAQKAFVSLVHDGAMAGTGVGLQYFPLDGIAPASCSAKYDRPEVEIAPLPGNAGPLSASIQQHTPTSFTPTGAALVGAISHMKTWAGAHPGRLPFVLLVTDGFPTECDPTDLSDVAAIAGEAFDNEPKVHVGVIGFNLGPGGRNLDGVAQAGGTGVARLINDGDGVDQFVNAVRSILAEPGACQ